MRIAMVAMLGWMMVGAGAARAQDAAPQPQVPPPTDPHVVPMTGPAAFHVVDAHVVEVLSPEGDPVGGLAWPGLWRQVDGFGWTLLRPPTQRRS